MSGRGHNAALPEQDCIYFFPFEECREHYHALLRLITQQAEVFGEEVKEEAIEELVKAIIEGACKAEFCASNGKILGLITYIDGISESGRTCYLEDVVVDKNHRKQQIGQHVFARALETVEENGQTGIKWAYGRNNEPIKKMLKKFVNIQPEIAPTILSFSSSETIKEIANQNSDRTTRLAEKTDAEAIANFLLKQPGWTEDKVKNLQDIIDPPLPHLSTTNEKGKFCVVTRDDNNNITGFYAFFRGYSTFAGRPNLHLGLAVSKNNNLQDDISKVMTVAKAEMTNRNITGSLQIDPTLFPSTMCDKIVNILISLGAIDLVYKNGTQMISGELSGTSLQKALLVINPSETIKIRKRRTTINPN